MDFVYAKPIFFLQHIRIKFEINSFIVLLLLDILKQFLNIFITKNLMTSVITSTFASSAFEN